MRNVAVVVEDEPSQELLDEMEIEPGDTLFGLYQGTPLPERSWAHGNNLPDRISIYQKPTEEPARPTTRSATASPRPSSTSSATTSG
jgi:predicted Zn-dependent protease with MMP-like domain